MSDPALPVPGPSDQPTLPPTAPPEGVTLPPAAPEGQATLPPQAQAGTLAASSSPAGGDARAPGGYEIETELGRGGMGVVYKARSLALQRSCALKMILSGAHSGADEIERFRTEAQAIARLQHPGIVQVFEVGEYDGRPFMALEFCAGGSLDAVLAKSPLTPKDAAKLVKSLAEAVHAAHQARVLHRDLKPANVLLTDKGTPKVTDFGLAKKLDEDGATRTGSVMGTPSYMPPEQAQGRKDIGPAADTYALGAILYECLASRPPFRAATAFDTLMQVLTAEPVPVRQLNPNAPLDLETIAHKCLQKDPKTRYATAQDLADDLGRYLGGEPIKARPVGAVERTARWARRNPAVAASLAAVVAVVLAAGAVVTWQLGQTRAALAEVLSERSARALAQVDVLRTAAPQAVPGILEDLARRPDILPAVRAKLDEAAPGDKARQRLGLALLATEPDLVRDALVAGLLAAPDPAEVLLLRDGLAAHGAALAPGLWERVGAAGTGPGERFRCHVALAAWDPTSPNWATGGAEVTRELLTSISLYRGDWVKAFEPVKHVLLAPLGEVFRGKTLAEQRQTAAEVLAIYAADRADVVSELLLDADAKQYEVLRPLLARQKAELVARLTKAVSGPPVVWADAPLDPAWGAVPGAVRAEVEAASGLMAERFARCAALPLERVGAVTESLRQSGYRPTRVRPWSDGEVVKAAVVWQRDGRGWKLEGGLTAEQVKARHTAVQKEGYRAEDVAGYVAKAGLRHQALWVRAGQGESSGVYVDVGSSQIQGVQGAYTKDGYAPWTIQAVMTDGGARHAGVWVKGVEVKNWWWNSDMDAGTWASRNVDKLGFDVACYETAPSDGPELEDLFRRQLREAETGLEADRNNLGARWLRSLVLWRLGRDAEALAEMDQVLPTVSTPDAYEHRAQMLARLGREQEAQESLRMYIEISKASASDRWRVERNVAVSLGRRDALREIDATLRSVGDDPDWVLKGAGACAQGLKAHSPERQRQAEVLAVVGGLPGLWEGLLVADRLTRVQGRFGQRDGYRDRALDLLERLARLPGSNMVQSLSWHDLEPLHAEPRYRALWRNAKGSQASGVWHGRPDHDSLAESASSLKEALTRSAELGAGGWRPVALGVVRQGVGARVLSSWFRPVLPAGEIEAAARREAARGVTLLNLGAGEEAWPLWRASPDPTVRTYLIERSASRGVPARVLVDRLLAEKDAGTRRALVVALGEYDEKGLPAMVRGPLTAQLLEWYRNDPDPGVHGAIDWLLRHGKEGKAARALDWGQGKELAKIDGELKSAGPDGKRGWYVNGQGQTFALIKGPVTFRMGTAAGTEEGEDRERPQHERQHERRIGRSFAVGTKAVTVEQWERYLKARGETSDHSRRYSPERDTPITDVNWYQAAQYCNWLSEKEGVPESQWCYPKEIKAGMKPHGDYLRRTGYRLPSEAEWEYACRGGTVTASSYGAGLELLSRYAWYQANSEGRTWPVGQKRPNDLGCFDLHGNVSAWCNEPFDRYQARSGVVGDIENVNFISDNGGRVRRGASFFSHAPEVRSAHRVKSLPGVRFVNVGVRLCRTSH